MTAQVKACLFFSRKCLLRGQNNNLKSVLTAVRCCPMLFSAPSLTLSSASAPLSIPVNSFCSWNAFFERAFPQCHRRRYILQILHKGTGTNAPFDDVTQAHPLVDYIQLMKANGITSGCGATTCCPHNTTSRGQMAVFIMRAYFSPR